MRFANPLFLVVLLPLVLVVFWDFRRRWSRARLGFSYGELFPRRGWRARVSSWLPAVFAVVGLLLILALARPQTGASRVEIKSEGIDIMLALDISGSMRAEDFKPNNRLHVAKDVAKKFVAGRSGDRVGLVVFAGGAYTQCPLTMDYGILQSLLDAVDFGQVPDGTAIGMALATSINRLREAEGESRVVILLTDGQNNSGQVDPLTAAEAARALGVRVYTIGAGTDGPARVPVDDMFGRRYVTIEAKLDEVSLKEIARITGGRYFRATSPEALAAIYEEIDQMEKTEAKTVEYVQYNEKGPLLALIAALVLVGGMAISETVGNRIP